MPTQHGVKHVEYKFERLFINKDENKDYKCEQDPEIRYNNRTKPVIS